MLSQTLLRNTCSSTVLSRSPTSSAAFFSSRASSLSCFCLRAVIGVLVILTSICGMQSTALGVHFERSPESAVAPRGDEVVFECELNLAPDRLEWKFRHSSNRSNIDSHFQYLSQEDGYNITNEDRISMLRVFVQPESLGDYQCVASYGSASIASLSARLTLVSISIDNSNGYTRNAKIYNVAPKNCVLLRCGSITSNPAAIWSFYRNGEKLPETEMIPTNGALILKSVTAKDSGNYTCSAMNPITGQEVKLPQRIDLRVEYSDRNPPYFLILPVNQVTARPGETVVLECPGVGSPPPSAVWSSPNVMNMNNSNRTRLLPYGLQIIDVKPEDQGSYVCRLDNGIAPPLVHTIKFTVMQKPTILRGPASTLTNESDTLELECSATGNPYPKIYWFINGIDTTTDEEMMHDGRRLVIEHVRKRHAGIVQCFAKNEVGETSAANLLKMNPKQIRGSSTPLGDVPTKGTERMGKRKTKGRKKQQKATMIPPSRPNITRLSDESVMLRWYVPRNDGLLIEFFKVQYRMLGDSERGIKRENWQTANEEIHNNNMDRNTDVIQNYTASVTGLIPDRLYRFRIIAVYTNNDNKEGNISAKFFLRKGKDLDILNLPIPELQGIEPLSESAVMLHWSMPKSLAAAEVDGFYAYYRPASSAGEYYKTTVDGMKTRRFKIDLLEAGTMYEFKLQSFNQMAASDFSVILPGLTKKIATTIPPALATIIPASKANQEDNSIYPIVAGAAGGGVLLLIATITACLCMKKKKNSQAEDENKPQLDHLQADFVTPQVLGVNNHHKSQHRLNGVLPRMNITPNPLAQEADKAHLASQGIHYSQPYYQTPATPTLMTKRDYQQPPPVPPHQNNNHTSMAALGHHLPPSGHQAPLTPFLDTQRRTLDRSLRNLPYCQNGTNIPNNHEASMNMEGMTTRIPSLRRARRTSGSSANNVANNPNGGLGLSIGVAAASPRIQRSPLPTRAAMMKQRSRLGSHNDNISSGSLNSIEV